nr:MAG TPA: NinG protein [Bacteriophage sp.]
MSGGGYYRRCPNCHKLYTGDRCPDCAKKFGLALTKRRLREDEGRKLYASKRWRKLRDTIRLHYMDYDVWLLGVGIVRKCAPVVIHHIVERDKNPDLIYDLDNLITVSPESHAEIHSWYKRDRAAAVARIAAGKEYFRKLMGDGYDRRTKQNNGTG